MAGLMRHLYGLPKSTDIGGFKVQTSVYGSPIPIAYGMTRVAGNLLHMPATPILVHQSKAASKGAGGGSTYSAPMIIGLCEGPIGGIGKVWRDKDAAVQFVGTYDAEGWLVALGTSAPSPWSLLTGTYPLQALGYQFTAYVANAATPLPNNSMSSYSWEVRGFLPFGGPSSVVDASPADVIPDLLTNTRYGIGWSASRIGSLTAFQDYCAAYGTFISPTIDAQQTARDHINEFLEVSNTGAVWSDGVIKFVPYGDAAQTANGRTFTPNTTPLYDLTADNFLPLGADPDPVKVTRKDPATTFNQVTVEYEDRSYDYNTQTLAAIDQGAVELYGVIPMPVLQVHSAKLAPVAQQVAQIRLQREQSIRNEYTFRAGWTFSLLEPMDLVTLSVPALGLNFTPVRITAVTELSDEMGLEFTAEDWPFGTASATLYGTSAGAGTRPNANVDPGNTATPIIFEGPSALQSSPLELWVGASGGDFWGGCDVYISVDNATFTKVGQIIGKATFGLTTAALANNAAYPVIDTTHTLSVNTTLSLQTLSAQSQQAFDNRLSMCYVGGEFVAYRDLALTSAFHYNLTHLYRGLYGSTIPASHASGSSFVLCDETLLHIPWPQGKIGQVVYFKFPAFNIYGAALQDLSTVTSVAHTIGQDPITPGGSSNSDAIAQGTVSIDANGNCGFSADFTPTAVSFRWLAGTIGYPTDALTTSSGTVFNLGGLHTGTVNNATTIGFGQSLFVTIVPFTGASGTGTALQPIHIRGSYLTYTASKTANYSPGGFVEGTNPSLGRFSDANGNLLCGSSPTTATQNFYLSPVIPSGTSGVTIQQVAVDLWFPSQPIGGVTAVDYFFSRKTTGGGSTALAFANATLGLGWQTLTAGISENTASRSYELNVQFDVHSGSAQQAGAGNLAITYTMPDPKQTL